MGGKFVIFRVTDENDDEDNVTDKIEFDGDASVPDGKGGLISFNPVMSRTPTENPAPFQQVSRKPDTGFGGNRYTINVVFDESDGNRAGGIAKLRDWLAEDNASSVFREGRFGIRNDYRPEFNLTPRNDAGYKLIHFDTSQELVYRTITHAVIILEFSGSAGRVGE